MVCQYFYPKWNLGGFVTKTTQEILKKKDTFKESLENASNIINGRKI